MMIKNLTAFSLLWALFLSGCSTINRISSSNRETPAAEHLLTDQESKAVITLERTVCFGFCPVYTLTIYGDGRVEYDGQQNVDVTGKQTSQITPDKVKELLTLFEKADYFNLEDEYIAPVTDLPTTITSLTLGDQYKMIKNYGGCLDGSPVPAPQALCELENQIDEIVNTAQWIGQP